MTVFGLTGPSGAGKTTALRAVESLGGAVFDCDRVYAELLETSADLLTAINTRFPGTVTEGTLDRRALAAAVFGNEAELAALNAITHPRVAQEVRERLNLAKTSGAPLACVDAIALFESGLANLCDETVFITAPLDTRIVRIMERDGIDRPYAEARVRAQHPDPWFEERCDHKLVNHFSDSEEFFRHCQEFFRRFL